MSIPDLKHHHDIFVDGYGKWGPGQPNMGYFRTSPKIERISATKMKSDSPPWDWKMRSYLYYHPDVGKNFCKKLFLAYKAGQDTPITAVVSYQ